MALQRLTASERRFFSLVRQAVYANPFGERRDRVDLEIAGFAVETTTAAGFEETIGEIRRHIDCLEKENRADIRGYAPQDRDLLTSAFLFDLFHCYADRFDRLIEEQLAAGDRSLPVLFASAAADQLTRWGFGRGTAFRYLALCYQLRRAYFFIERHLKGRSESMRRLRESLWDNVFTHDMDRYHRFLWNRMEDFSTLLLGETGSGKGTAAMAIGRSGFIPFDEKNGCFEESFTRSFTALNLSQYPASLIESELFGHRKGAFTGAVENYAGLLDRCSPYGAIFLDEIGEVGEPIQIKLLQVLQERRFSRVGDHRARAFRGRVIAATNLAIQRLQDGRTMRRDFFYRLCSDIIIVPPLAQRIQEDPNELEDLIPVVARRIVGTPAGELADWIAARIRQSPGIDYSWPGNVRELEQCVRRILLKNAYSPLSVPSPPDLVSRLQAGIRNGSLDINALVGGYCLMLYRQHGTIEAVARNASLDRRTVKKYIAAGDQWLAGQEAPAAGTNADTSGGSHHFGQRHAKKC